MRPLPTFFALAAAAAFGGFVALGLYQTIESPAKAAQEAPLAPLPSVPVAASSGLPTAVDGQALPSLAPMLKQVTPAVVSVYSRQTIRVSSPLGPFADLFGMLSISRERVQRALGSGVIIDAQRGLILTNHHVVENADGVSVTLIDGSTVEAEFLGSDPDTDVALIRIHAKGLTQVPLGNSDQLQVGDFVVAMGNPYGLGQTVTSGIVSAVGRSGIPVAGYQNFIQTDASINPGNSGGALVNLQGQLVGINTASFNPSGSMAGNIGLGFAIPINLARNIAEQLYTNNGVVRRGTLGVSTQNVTQRLAEVLGMETAYGVLITNVYSDSAAASVGLKTGDVLLQVNGQRIADSAALHNFEGLQGVGSKVELQAQRDGKLLNVVATLKEQLREIAGDTLDPRLTGATFNELDESTRQALRANGMQGGIKIGQVKTNSRASRNGLRSGDIIIGGTIDEFSDLRTFRESLSSPPQQLGFVLLRGGQMIRLLLK